MELRSEQPTEEVPVDRLINRTIRAAVAAQGTTVTELGRRLGVPHSSWARKVTDGPAHQRYTAAEVVRIAAALGLTANDLLYGAPVLSLVRD